MNLVATRRRGRPAIQKFRWPLGLADTDLEKQEALQKSVAEVLRSFLRELPTLGEETVKGLVVSIVRELRFVQATQDHRRKVTLPRRGRKPNFPVQIFLVQLEKHFAAAGISLVEWRWGDKDRKQALALAGELLPVVGIRAPSYRQWRQRQFFR